MRPFRRQIHRRVVHVRCAEAGGSGLAIPRGPGVTRRARWKQGFRSRRLRGALSAWWHWVNGCITREGITADLESMKRIDLAGATIFTVQQSLVLRDGAEVKGPVTFMTPEEPPWSAMPSPKPNRLGLELSTMNCEGWGQAGGPAVTPAESMQKLVWTEVGDWRAKSFWTFRSPRPGWAIIRILR